MHGSWNACCELSWEHLSHGWEAMNRRSRWSIFAAGVLLLVALLLAVQKPLKPNVPEANPYPYYVVIDEQTGKELVKLPHKVQPGDEWITTENRVYRVRKVQGNKALARFHHRIVLPDKTLDR